MNLEIPVWARLEPAIEDLSVDLFMRFSPTLDTWKNNWQNSCKRLGESESESSPHLPQRLVILV